MNSLPLHCFTPSVWATQALEKRFDWFLEQESSIIQSQEPGPRLHAWPAGYL